MSEREGHFVRQLKNITIWLLNFVYNITPFFVLKNIVLSLSGIRIGKGSVIHTPVRFLGAGKMTIAANSVINFGCYLDNRVGIRIGENVSIAHNTKIYSLGHDIDDPFFASKGKEVVIDDYVCIFSNVLIMPGVHLGKGCVVYAGAVVTKDVGDYEVVGGNPAKFIRYRSRDLRYKIEYSYWFSP